jgi:WD40 repeat protein
MSEARHAVLIGTSKHPDEPRLSPLRCPENDVAGILERLTSPRNGLFDPTNVAAIVNAPSHEVLQTVERTIRKVTKNDLLLIYYSGHGQCDEAGRLHLAALNTRLDTLGSTSLPIDQIKSYIDLARTNRIILILDCCYSGAVGGAFIKGGVEEELQQVSRGQGIYIVTASSAIQVAQEKEGDRYSLLTKHLLDGLSEKEADVDGDGFISMDELYAYVDKNVRLEGAQQPTKFAVKVQGDLIIGRSGKVPRDERRKQIYSLLFELTAKGHITDLLLDQAKRVNSLPAQALSRESQRQTDLLDQLLEKKIEVGQFIERWYNVGNSPSPPLAQTSTYVASADKLQEQVQTLVLRRTLPRQTGGVLAGALSPRGGLLVTGSGDGTVWIWDAWTGELKAKAQGSRKPVLALSFSPDGSTIAAGGSDGLVRIWSWRGELLQTLEKQHESVLALAYSDDGEQIISGGMDDSLAVHSLPRGSVRTFATAHGTVNRVVFSDKLLVSAGRDRALRLWELETGKLAKTLDAHNDSVYTLAMSANGRLLASGGRDGTVRLWETSTWVRQTVLRGHKHSVLSVAIHPNGRTIASGSADGTIKFWDAANQELTASIESGHISVNFVVFPPDGEWLASGGTDQTVRFWELGGSGRRRVGA